MRIYVASSWRCDRQPGVVAALRAEGHDVYDFRNPEPGNRGFSWRQIDPDRSWLADPARFRAGLQHPVARRGFDLDMGALKACDVCVLVLPCGRSAHLELGWVASAPGKRAIVLLDDPVSEPELMYLACDEICVSLEEVIAAIRRGPGCP
jgi:hypothetical protein